MSLIRKGQNDTYSQAQSVYSVNFSAIPKHSCSDEKRTPLFGYQPVRGGSDSQICHRSLHQQLPAHSSVPLPIKLSSHHHHFLKSSSTRKLPTLKAKLPHFLLRQGSHVIDSRRRKSTFPNRTVLKQCSFVLIRAYRGVVHCSVEELAALTWVCKQTLN